MRFSAILGFDSYLVKVQSQGDKHKSSCYFCNDVNSPSDQTIFRTLDQMCTVTRPGLAAIASGVAVELVASITQMSEGAKRCVEDTSLLGSTPDQVRGFLILKQERENMCLSACSDPNLKGDLSNLSNLTGYKKCNDQMQHAESYGTFLFFIRLVEQGISESRKDIGFLNGVKSQSDCAAPLAQVSLRVIEAKKNEKEVLSECTGSISFRILHLFVKHSFMSQDLFLKETCTKEVSEALKSFAKTLVRPAVSSVNCPIFSNDGSRLLTLATDLFTKGFPSSQNIETEEAWKHIFPELHKELSFLQELFLSVIDAIPVSNDPRATRRYRNLLDIKKIHAQLKTVQYDAPRYNDRLNQYLLGMSAYQFIIDRREDLARDNTGSGVRVLQYLASNPEDILSEASVKLLFPDAMVPKFQYFMLLFLAILKSTQQNLVSSLATKKKVPEESQTRFVDVMSRVELFEFRKPDCLNALFFYLNDAENKKIDIFEVHDKCSTGTDNLFRDEHANLIPPKLPLGVNPLSVNPLEFLWNEANSIMNMKTFGFSLPQTQSGDSVNKVIFYYAAYKLIIDRKYELKKNSDRIIRVVRKLLYFESLEPNVARVLDWTVQDHGKEFIDGLLTAVVTFAGINLVEGKSFPKEETKKLIIGELTAPNINDPEFAKRARVSVCMFRMIKLNKDYVSLFQFANDYLRTGKVTQDKKTAAWFDYCEQKKK